MNSQGHIDIDIDAGRAETGTARSRAGAEGFPLRPPNIIENARPAGNYRFAADDGRAQAGPFAPRDRFGADDIAGAGEPAVFKSGLSPA